MKVVVGLGNPGPRYRKTRHNVGFWVAERLAERLGASFSREKYGGLIAEAPLDGLGLARGSAALILKPLTFMNNSGLSVARAARYRLHDVSDLLVAVDDADLPLGKIRLRARGSAGGHNGLKSIIERLGTREFARLRMGIGRETSRQDLRDHVLGTFAPDEKADVDEMVERATEATLRFLTAGIERAMNEFN